MYFEICIFIYVFILFTHFTIYITDVGLKCRNLFHFDKISLFLSLPFRNDCVQPNHLCVIIDYIIIPNYKHLHKLETTAIYILL